MRKIIIGPIVLVALLLQLVVQSPAHAAVCAPTQTVSGAYTILQFNAVGTCTYQLPSTFTSAEYLIVGGGGGGGNNAGDGGGGGSYVAGKNTQSAGATITVTVGDGGVGGIDINSPLRTGQNGSSSSVTFADGAISANGGAGGMTYWSGATPYVCGGSSHGATTYSGNGGAGGLGANGAAGNGVVGYKVTVFPPSNLEAQNYSYFAGGGGGGAYGTSAVAGTGVYGGGNGSTAGAGADATSNTGGGGGGGAASCSNGGKGGSGTVIFRCLNSLQYPNSNYAYPTVTGTLAARYQLKDFNGLAKTWGDSSGQGQNIVTVGGSPYIAIDTATSVANSGSDQYALTGITTDTFKVPFAASTNYTIFSVARYTSLNSAYRYRIISTEYSSGNWLHGFYNGYTGWAYHGNTWITPSSTDNNAISNSTSWVISSDQQNLYRSMGSQKSTTNGGSVAPVVAVNMYSSELSDWQMEELIIYNTQLSLSDIQAVENYLTNQYIRGINYSSLTISGGNTAVYRTPTTLTLSVRTPSKVTFYTNGKAVPGCKNVLSSATSATCNWLPAQLNMVQLSATAIPVNNIYSTATSSQTVIVAARAAGSHKR